MPLFFSGDFNCESTEEAIKLLKKNKFVDLYSYGKGIVHKKTHPDYTLIFDTNERYPERPTPKYCLLDYIMVWKNNFFKKSVNFAVTEILDLPTGKDKNATPTPDGDWPSDHFSLFYKIVIGYDAFIKSKSKELKASKKVIKKSAKTKEKKVKK